MALFFSRHYKKMYSGFIGLVYHKLEAWCTKRWYSMNYIWRWKVWNFCVCASLNKCLHFWGGLTMTRQVEALGSSPRPLLFPTTPLLLLLPAPPSLLLLILIQRSGDNIAKSIRLCCRAKDCGILNWVKRGQLRWVRKVVQPAVDCRYLGSWPASG